LLEAAVCGGWTARDITATSATARRMPAIPHAGASSDPSAVRAILSRAAGVLRDAEGLRSAARSLLPLAMSRHAASDPALVGLMIVIAALRREESRGAHARTDFPDRQSVARRSTLRIHEAIEAAQDCVPEAAL
jgi:L-aspartate oxidase